MSARMPAPIIKLMGIFIKGLGLAPEGTFPACTDLGLVGVGLAADEVRLVVCEIPVPGMPVVSFAPRLPILREAPRLPIVVLIPDLLKLILRPGRILNDFRKRNGMIPSPFDAYYSSMNLLLYWGEEADMK